MQICQLLGNEGYPHFVGSSLVRSSEDEVLIEEDLKAYLLNRYQSTNLSETEAQSIILQLKTLSSADLYESNKKIMRWLADGFIPTRGLSAVPAQAGDRSQKAFYDILKDLCIKYDFKYPEDKLIVLAQAVKELVDSQAKYPDWSKREDIKSALKVGLIILLDEHGYPPVERDEVYKDIFEQAENFNKNRVITKLCQRFFRRPKKLSFSGTAVLRLKGFLKHFILTNNN